MQEIIGVIHSTPVPTYTSRMLLEELKRRGIDAKYIYLARIGVSIGDGEEYIMIGGKEIKIRAALVRGLGYLSTVEQFMSRIALLKFLEDSGSFLMNSLDSLIITRNKFLTLSKLHLLNIPVPKTLLSESLFYLYKNIRNLKNGIVIKPITGSRGFGSTMTNDPDIAFQVIKTLLPRGLPPLIQRFILKPKRDIRAFVIGNEVVACMYRLSEKWKTNISQGAIGVNLKPSEEIIELSLKAAKAIGLEYAGVDIAEENEQHFVLEVNGSPDFRGLMKASKVNIPRLLINHFLNRLKR